MRYLCRTDWAECINGARVCAALALLCLLAACDMREPESVHTSQASVQPMPALRDPPPEPIRGFYPGYVLVETQDLDQGDIALFLDEETRATDPWALSWVRADFDGNGVGDHAVLLRTPDGLLPVYETFAILMGGADGQYEVVAESSYRGFTDYQIISQVRPGTIVRSFAGDGGPDIEVRLRNPAIELAVIGKTAVVFYWDFSTGSIEAIPTAD